MNIKQISPAGYQILQVTCSTLKAKTFRHPTTEHLDHKTTSDKVLKKEGRYKKIEFGSRPRVPKKCRSDWIVTQNTRKNKRHLLFLAVIYDRKFFHFRKIFIKILPEYVGSFVWCARRIIFFLSLPIQFDT